MFQFLIGSLGTFQEYSPRGKSRQFQFLIGSLGTLTYKAVYGIIFQFQFLIGSLGTLLKITKQEASESFNSLQVVQVLGRIRGRRLKNYSFNSLQVVQVHIRYSVTVDRRGFQFLIGSLGTLENSLIWKRLDKVSIPYRQSRYQMLCLQGLYNFLFQFLIGSLGTRKERYK